MAKSSTVEHYEHLADEAQSRVDAAATILGISNNGNFPWWLGEAYEALLDLGVSRPELEAARARAGI